MKFILILSAFFMLSACATEFAELNIGKFSSEPTNADETASEEDIVELKPNFFGFGIDLRALWRKFFG